MKTIDQILPGLAADIAQALSDIKPEVSTLTKAQIDAVFNTALRAKFVLPGLSAEPTTEEIEADEALVVQLDRDFEVSAQAELQEAEAVASIRARAVKLAEQIGATVAAAGTAIVLKAVENATTVPGA